MSYSSHLEIREELQRVLQSKNFARAKKKSRFLEFICEQTLNGDADKLNEYLVGVEVYGRGTDFDTQNDPIVRVQAHEIRRSLKEYYEDEGKNNVWRIDIPPGHYVPQFIKTEIPEKAGRSSSLPAGQEPFFRTILRWHSSRWVVVVLLLSNILLGGLLITEHLGNSPKARAGSAGLPESMDWFWGPFLTPGSPALIVIPNHPLLRAAHEGDPPGEVARAHKIPKDELPEFRDTIHYRELRDFLFLPTTTDFTGIGEALGSFNLFEFFKAHNQEVRLKPARLVDFEELKRGNAILLGGNQNWSGKVFLYPEGFHFLAGLIKNVHPLAGEPAYYKPEFDPLTLKLSRDYALILMLPNERKDQRILLLYGIYSQGSQAAIEYVTNPEHMQALKRQLILLTKEKKNPPKFFQALIQTTVENQVPGRASFVSARIIPE